jgi:hypothetical protein
MILDILFCSPAATVLIGVEKWHSFPQVSENECHFVFKGISAYLCLDEFSVYTIPIDG